MNPVSFNYLSSSFTTFNPNSLFLAIKEGNLESLNHLLNSHFSSKMLSEALLFSYSEDKWSIVKLIINHPTFSVDAWQQTLSSANYYDKNGNYVPLELAKAIENPSLKKEAIIQAEKQLGDKSNESFGPVFQKQLSFIRQSLTQAAKKIGQFTEVKQDNDWLSKLSSVQQSINEAQRKALQKVMANKESLTIVGADAENLCAQVAETKKVTQINHYGTAAGSADIVLAPPTIYKDLEDIFKASEGLLRKEILVEAHPLFHYFKLLNKDGVFIVTLHSGPNVEDFTNLMLNNHELELNKPYQKADLKLKIFKNVETFFRCLDIFKTFYKEQTGKTIQCELSYCLPHIPLQIFCEEYVKQHPELAMMGPDELEKFIRLLSVFNIGQDIIDLNLTLCLSIKDTETLSSQSFRPIALSLEGKKESNNDISFAQQNLDKQIQNLNGSELSMPYIKDADGPVQFESLKQILNRKKINFVELGGGRGETNAVPYALSKNGTVLHLLNVEPYEPFAKLYIDAHQAVGIKDVDVIQLKAQSLSSPDVFRHYKEEKATAIFASHSFYFLLGDLHKSSQIYAWDNMSQPLNQHPLWKFFEMMDEESVFVLTLQSGCGARLFRNALLGNHGLNATKGLSSDETISLLNSFGNLATFLRHFELFSQRYEKDTNKKINVNMRHSVANVPLGDFKIEQDAETGGYLLAVNGKDNDPNWLAPKMLDFYGNWNELQTLATLTLEKAKKMSIESLKKLEIDNLNPQIILEKREKAKKMQEVFLHILRVFAPSEKTCNIPILRLRLQLIIKK